MIFFRRKFLPALFLLKMYQTSAQSSYQTLNLALITHLNQQVVFSDDDISNGISGEMLLILVADSGKVNEVILKKGLTASLNDEVMRACNGFVLPDGAISNRYAIMLYVDNRLKRISPLLRN